MSKRTDSSVASVGHAGQSAGALIEGGMRRILVVATLAVGAVLLVASVAFACTTYWGQITIENLSDSNTGEFSVVADPTSGMDRCDDAMDGASSSPLTPDNSGDNVRVEISKWEPGTGGQDEGGHDCEASQFGDDDDNGAPEHSLADAGDQGDNAVEDVYINTFNGDAYDDDPNDDGNRDDDDGDGVYEDNDEGVGKGTNADNETNGEASTERVGDCMGDGDSDGDGQPDSQGDVIHKAGPIGVLSYKSDTDGDGKDDGGEFDDSHSAVNDDDSDGINDVEITIDTAPASSSMHAGAICVSEGDGGDSAPQVPIVIT